jgi:hypothetical protein
VEETLTEPEEVRAEAESPETRPETEEEAGLGLEPPSGPEETEEGSASEAGFQSVEFPELEDESSAGARFDGGANAGASGDSRPSPAAAVPAREELEAVTDLEVLPDMDSLEEGENPESREELGESGPLDAGPSTRRAPSTPREMRQAQIEETVKDQDPENLARAVRTFLKKDQ